MNKTAAQTGFGLLEVLITLVVLGFGLISMARFQGTVLQDSGLAKARTVAAQSAQEKMEDLRSFTVLVTPSPQTNPPTASYAAIGNDTGGSLNADGTLIEPSGTITVSAVEYNRTWTVQNYYFSTPSSEATTTLPTLAPAFPDFKTVEVTVTWTDQDNIQQNIVLDTIISASDPARSGRVLQ